jgi:predicted nuclease of predicted toxin-antitoxin system
MRFLIDECLHTSLVAVANRAGHEAHHVVYRGLSGCTDLEVVAHAIKGDFVLVTNNAVDFRKLYKAQPLHPGLIIIVPQLEPEKQRAFFAAALAELAKEEPINTVIEVKFTAGTATVSKYTLPEE